MRWLSLQSLLSRCEIWQKEDPEFYISSWGQLEIYDSLYQNNNNKKKKEKERKEGEKGKENMKRGKERRQGGTGSTFSKFGNG